MVNGKLQPAKINKQSKYPTINYRERGKRKCKSCHIVVAEALLQRKLFGDETVHHCNHQTKDFKATNLCVVTRQTHDLIEKNHLKVKSNIV